MAQFGCGGSRCTCQVVAGPGATVTGNGSPGSPYVVSAGAGTVTCDQVRPCLSAGPGATYDPATGVIGADPTVVEAGTNTTVTGTGTAADPYVVNADAADPTVVEAGDNVTVTGTGTAADPYVVNADAADPTVVQAGDRATVTGTGTAADPYVVSADPPSCDDVRPCLAAGTGIDYDPATGTISAEPTVVEAGTNTTVTGTGTAADPYVVSSAGGGGVSTVVTAGDRTTVTGTGTLADPYVVNADPPSCDDVRPCLVAGDGIAYDAATGTIAARPSTDPGNLVEFGTDGGLLVGAPAALETGCGLAGDGSAATPLAAAVTAWPYPCDVDANAGGVYCDSTGALRSEPRGLAQYASDQQVLNPADLPVPAAEDTEVATHEVTITNPDPCRPAFVILESEADADFNLPAGAGAALGILTDEMSYLRNNGTSAILDTHIQGTKVASLGSGPGQLIPPGGSVNYVLSIRMGRGSGGATYNRVQSFVRYFLFVL
jgi:hypothetical protein